MSNLIADRYNAELENNVLATLSHIFNYTNTKRMLVSRDGKGKDSYLIANDRTYIAASRYNLPFVASVLQTFSQKNYMLIVLYDDITLTPVLEEMSTTASVPVRLEFNALFGCMAFIWAKMPMHWRREVLGQLLLDDKAVSKALPCDTFESTDIRSEEYTSRERLHGIPLIKNLEGNGKPYASQMYAYDHSNEEALRYPELIGNMLTAEGIKHEVTPCSHPYKNFPYYAHIHLYDKEDTLIICTSALLLSVFNFGFLNDMRQPGRNFIIVTDGIPSGGRKHAVDWLNYGVNFVGIGAGPSTWNYLRGLLVLPRKKKSSIEHHESTRQMIEVLNRDMETVRSKVTQEQFRPLPHLIDIRKLQLFPVEYMENQTQEQPLPVSEVQAKQPVATTHDPYTEALHHNVLHTLSFIFTCMDAPHQFQTSSSNLQVDIPYTQLVAGNTLYIVATRYNMAYVYEVLKKNNNAYRITILTDDIQVKRLATHLARDFNVAYEILLHENLLLWPHNFDVVGWDFAVKLLPWSRNQINDYSGLDKAKSQFGNYPLNKLSSDTGLFQPRGAVVINRFTNEDPPLIYGLKPEQYIDAAAPYLKDLLPVREVGVSTYGSLNRPNTLQSVQVIFTCARQLHKWGDSRLGGNAYRTTIVVTDAIPSEFRNHARRMEMESATVFITMAASPNAFEFLRLMVIYLTSSGYRDLTQFQPNQSNKKDGFSYHSHYEHYSYKGILKKLEGDTNTKSEPESKPTNIQLSATVPTTTNATNQDKTMSTTAATATTATTATATSAASAAAAATPTTFQEIKEYSKEYGKQSWEGAKDGAALEAAHTLTDAAVSGIAKFVPPITLFYATSFGQSLMLFLVPYTLGIISFLFPGMLLGLSPKFVRSVTTRAARAASANNLQPILRAITKPVREALLNMQIAEGITAEQVASETRERD